MFDRNPDQELFEETTRRFLQSEAPLNQTRALAGTEAGFDPGYWRKGAELGWTSLAVPEDAGGGSISGHGIIDLVLLAHQFGLHVAPGPLLPTNVVAAAIGRRAPSEHGEVLSGLLSGERVAAWAFAEPGLSDARGTVLMEAVPAGDGIVLSGSKSPVEAGGQATDILVVAHEGSGLSQFLVPQDTPGLSITPLQGLDLTKRFARVDFESVRIPAALRVGAAGDAADDVAWLARFALLIQVSEMLGCLAWSLETTLDWANQRYSFGRPLASYQEIKHRFADMKMWLEAGYGIVDDAAAALQGGSPNADDLMSAAKYYVGHYGPELVQDCVQLHGGIGVTFDHDLHLFLRRVTTSVPLLGAPAEHARWLGRKLRSRLAVSGGGEE